MRLKSIITFAAAMFLAVTSIFAKDVTYSLTSPDGHISATVTVGEDIRYTVSRDGQILIAPSAVSMRLSGDVVFGQNDKVRRAVRTSFDKTFPAVAYKKA